VAVFRRPDGINAMAVVFQAGENWGVATYRLTGEGFEEGPALAAQPLEITAMAAGNFSQRPGEELALGMLGGMIRLTGTGPALEVILVTETLGTLVSALASRRGDTADLAAGTPEGHVFVFYYPVERRPQAVFSPGEGISGLAFLQGEKVAVGTENGSLQIWSADAGGKAWNYIVRSGDTLWSISLKVGISVESILAANEESIVNPQLIMPGQTIRIPSGN
jgi:nucleoid-associated protein YgaU